MQWKRGRGERLAEHDLIVANSAEQQPVLSEYRQVGDAAEQLGERRHGGKIGPELRVEHAGNEAESENDVIDRE